MTTIAANSMLLAADNLINDDSIKSFEYKIALMGDSAYAGAGTVSDIYKFMSWIEGGQKEKPVFSEEDGLTVLQLTNKGILYYWETSLVPMIVRNPFVAIGSGMDVALGAMHRGATPIEAVWIAGQVNVKTGYGVSWVELLPDGSFALNYEDPEQFLSTSVPKRYRYKPQPWRTE